MPDDFNRQAGPDIHGVAEPEDVLDPRHFAPVRKQAPSLRALPLWCYTSPRFFQAEMERVFQPSWNLLERVDLVPNRGDFQALRFMNIPLLMARGSDDRVRVFANTCRHRGALVATGSGNCKVFRCPYHSWTYALEGELLGTPAYDDADGNALIDATNKHEYALIEIPSATWGGFVFIRFKDAPGATQDRRQASLLEHLGNMPAQLASHRLEDMVCVRRKVYEMDANWKCFVENYSDGYHIPTVHRDSLARWKSSRATDVPPSNGNFRVNFSIHEGSQLLLPFPGYDGFPPMPQIDAHRKNGTFFCSIRPAMMMTLCNDGALVFRCEPLTATTSRLTVSSLFPKSTVARNDFDEIIKNYYRRIEIVVGEDVDISLRQMAGLNSPYARMARLCRTETSINDIANWVLDRVIGPAGAAAA